MSSDSEPDSGATVEVVDSTEATVEVVDTVASSEVEQPTTAKTSSKRMHEKRVNIRYDNRDKRHLYP
jgi:hypothetical protein